MKPERRQRAQTRMWLRVPLASLVWTRRRLGRWMLLVLMFEWLTLLATRRCLPQTSQCAAISNPSGRRVPLALADANRKQAPGADRWLPALAFLRDAGGLPLPANPACPCHGRRQGAGPHGMAERERRGSARPRRT